MSAKPRFGEVLKMKIKPGGQHIILECDNINEELLKNCEAIKKILEDAAQRSGARILHSYFHHFGGEYGVTGLVALAESHISIHTWPETGYAAIDIFMCGECDPLIASSYIISQINCETVNVTIINRTSRFFDIH